jgi:hypothetical protein
MDTEVKISVLPTGRMSVHPETVPIVPGDTVSFNLASNEKGAHLCMGAKTAEVLSLRPSSTPVEIAPGGTVSFTLGAAPSGEYWLMVSDSHNKCDIPDFLEADRAVLKIGVDLSGKESGPADRIRPRNA